MSSRARSGLLAELGEFRETAALMAAAAVGLRGEAAARAMRAAKREHAMKRWNAVCAVAVKRSESINEKRMRELEARVAAVLDEPAHVRPDDSLAEEQGDISHDSGSSNGLNDL